MAECSRRRPQGASRVKLVPSTPCDSTSVARTSAAGPRPKVRTVAAVTLRMAATRGSSAFSTASPSAGSAAGSSALARAIASRLPARSRWVGWTASTTPTSGRAISASRAISPSVYMLISRTRHLVRRLELEERHRQAGLAVEVALVAEDAEGPGEDVGHDLLGDRLAGRAGDADHAHARPRAPPGGHLLEGERADRRPARTATSAPAGSSTGRSTMQDRWRRRAPHRPRSGGRRCARRGRATKQQPGTTWRESTAAVAKEVTLVGPRRRAPVAARRSSSRIDGGTLLPAEGSAESTSLIWRRPATRSGRARWPGSRRSAAPGCGRRSPGSGPSCTGPRSPGGG